MSITNKRRFIHEANKKREGEPDLQEKSKVSRILKGYFGLTCVFHDLFIGIHKRHRYWVFTLTEEQALSNEFWPHKPDIMVTNTRKRIIIEIDGDVHFFSDRGVKRTNVRNLHYDLANIGLVWLTKAEVQNSDTMLAQILAERLLRFGIRPLDRTRT